MAVCYHGPSSNGMVFIDMQPQKFAGYPMVFRFSVKFIKITVRGWRFVCFDRANVGKCQFGASSPRTRALEQIRGCSGE